MINFFATHVKASQRGAAMLIFVIFFLFGSLALTALLAMNIRSDQKVEAILLKSKQSYVTALSANEDILYRYVKALTPDATESITLGGAQATSSITVNAGGDYVITSASNYLLAKRSAKMTLKVIPGISFNFGMQAGAGGIDLANTASVEGNIYSNGPIVGHNSAIIKGDAVSAGPSGSYSGLQATGTVRAHSILSSPAIGKDAYYQSIVAGATTVLGVKYPGSADQATTSLPITDATIASWEAEAAAGGTYSGTCPYVINANVILGPKKIPCDLSINSPGITVTIKGPVWVTGNITVAKGDVRIDSSLSGKIIPLIADKASDLTVGSLVDVQTGASFSSATGNSYTMLISMNKSGETGGSNTAVTVANSSAGELLVYAPHGILSLQNSMSLRQATAWKIMAQNSAVVKYKTGLINPNFTSGPAGTFTVKDWEETY